MSLPYFNLYPADFEADTSHLTLEEDGAYNRLLRLMWMTPGCSLPDDDAWIARRMRCDQETFQRVVSPLIEEFFTRDNGRVFSPRLMREFKKADVTSRKRSEAGKRGGRPQASGRKGKDEKPGFSIDKAGLSDTRALPEPEPEPEREEKDPKGSKKKTDSEQVREALTDVLPGDVAEAFIGHRNKLRKPMTPYAARLIAKKLGTARDPVACANLSIVKGWQDVFPEKGQEAQSGGQQDWFTGMREIQ